MWEISILWRVMLWKADEQDKMKDKITALIRDILLCVLIGLGITAMLALVLGLIGGIRNGFAWYSILDTIRNGLLVVGSLLLFVVAGLLLGHKGRAKISSAEKWQSAYRVLGPAAAFLIMAATILAIAVIVDYAVWGM